MKKLIIKTVIFIVAFFLFDALIGWGSYFMLGKLGEQNKYGKASMTCNNILTATPDVAIIGSSPALTAYIPHIIEDSIFCYTNSPYKVRNASCFVQGMPYFLTETKILTKRKKPDIIILDLTPHSLSDFNDVVSILYPYYHYDSDIRNMIDEKVGFWERLKLQSNLYCLNTTIAELFYGFLRGGNAEGYWAEYNELPEFKPEIIESSKVDSCNLALFKELISYTRENEIHLIVVTSPSSKYYDDSCETKKTIIQLCESNNIPYYDYTANKLFEDGKYFTDDSHLNDRGASLFSSRLSSDIKNELVGHLE